jgi:hypothetical protein
VSSKWSLSLRFPNQNPVCTSPLILATCPTYLTLLDLITGIILGEEYRSLSSLCSFLHTPVTSYLLGLNVLQGELALLKLYLALSVSQITFWD